MHTTRRRRSHRRRGLPQALGLCGLLTACHDGAPSAPPALPLHSDGQALLTREGDTQLLRGINARVSGLFDVSFTDGRQPLEPIPDFTSDDARRARQLGFNLLRLPLNWSGLEPQPGQYSTAYLDRVQEIVDRCRAAGIYVLLDMHQDAFSKEIGEDGAPLWAIQPPPDKLLGGPLTDLDARRLSGQVLRAFRGFFEENQQNAQERFTAAVQALLRRFATDEAVVGIELFNEPLAGQDALDAFHAKAAQGVRVVTDKLIFFEPVALRNQTDGVEPSAAPFPVAGAVYAPHIYTLAFSDPRGELARLTYERLAPSVRGARVEATAWGAPLFIGEFGIAPDAPNAALWLRYQLDAQDETLASSALWLWKEDSQGSWGLFDKRGADFVERPAYIAAVSRPYVQVAGGALRALRYDSEARRLRYQVQRQRGAREDQVYLPRAPQALRCQGQDVKPLPTIDSATGVLRVRCGESDLATVEIDLRP